MPDQSKKVDSARKTLRANLKYRQDKRTHAVERVKLYVEDVEGDWLGNWSDSNPNFKSSALEAQSDN